MYHSPPSPCRAVMHCGKISTTSWSTRPSSTWTDICSSSPTLRCAYPRIFYVYVSSAESMNMISDWLIDWWVGCRGPAQTRVAKRSRKLIDYDSARHHMETLQASGIKNDRKMVKVCCCPCPHCRATPTPTPMTTPTATPMTTPTQASPSRSVQNNNHSRTTENSLCNSLEGSWTILASHSHHKWIFICSKDIFQDMFYVAISILNKSCWCSIFW